MRYKVTYKEWVLTHNPFYPFQRKLVEQEEFFKTRNEAIEFYNLFKDDTFVKGLAVFDMVSKKKIL